MHWPYLISATLAVFLCGTAAWTDWRSGRIPNWLTLPAIGCGFLIGLIGGGGRGVLLSVIAALISLLVPLVLFRLKAMGGGDVKLFAALGALLGAGPGLEIQLVAFFFGALQGIGVWAKQGQLKQGFGRLVRWVTPRIFIRKRYDKGSALVGKTEIRFGPAIFLATVLVVTLRSIG
ncbi:MAG: A24 family peptidase [Myxococcota bacterium]|nr:A24 family peptidase [Myxococcota bacterium]